MECYKINEAEKDAKKIWNFIVKDPLAADSSKGE